jgi:hypothetical protein
MQIRAIKTCILAGLVALAPLAGCLSGSDGPENQKPAPDDGGSSNQPPTISGNATLAITIGDSYSFTPSASDPDGDPLTFSIDNRPSWASFNSNTGALTGTPTLGDVGSFTNIRISVSDGQASASLPGFRIDVSQVALGSATLSWTAPTQNEDGSALTNLAGYKIYYGRSSGTYSNEVRIDNPGVTSFVVENLSPDTYFFAATALNSAGAESRFSGEAVKTVN